MPVSEEQFRETMNKLAESVAASITATAALTGSQTNFLRAASSADSNIALSHGTPLLYSEVVDARLIDEQRCALFYYTVRAPRSLNRILGGGLKWKASNLPSVV